MSPKTTTEVVTKALARSGPEIRPDQIRLADEAQTDPKKVYTQSDVNQNGGGSGPGPAPDLTDYAKTEYVDAADDQLKTEVGSAAALANSAMEKATANTKAIEEIPEGGESYDDTAIKKEISDLQGAFDTAVIAAQEGAEQLEIELQSYAKKEDLPEGVNLEGYAKTDYVDSADNALNALIAANTQAIEDIEIPEGAGPDPRLPYEFVVGEQDSNELLIDTDASAGTAPTQILETLSLKDGEGTTCGGVAFESSGGIGVALSNRYENTILIQGSELEKAISANTEAIAAIEIPEIPEQVTYLLQTDKVLRSGEPAIELVDSEGNFSNVKVVGANGIVVTSDMQGLKLDGAVFATTASVDQKLAAQPSPTYVDWNNLPNLTV